MASTQTPRGLRQPEYRAKADLVYQEIRRAIMEGVFKPGDKLLTDELAAALRVSRMPVREAIKRLQVEGLVDVFPHKGATVASVTLEQVRDVYSVRAVLEGLAAREAAQRATAADVARLEGLYAEMLRLIAVGDTQALLAKNREFHDAIVEISGNKVLRPIAANLADSIERYRLQYISLPHRSEAVLEEHRRLIDAIARGAAEEAARIAHDHIATTGRWMVGHVTAEAEKAGEPTSSTGGSP